MTRTIAASKTSQWLRPETLFCLVAPYRSIATTNKPRTPLTKEWITKREKTLQPIVSLLFYIQFSYFFSWPSNKSYIEVTVNIFVHIVLIYSTEYTYLQSHIILKFRVIDSWRTFNQFLHSFYTTVDTTYKGRNTTTTSTGASRDQSHIKFE